MRVAIGGSTGLIGSAITQHLRRNGHQVVRLVRRETIDDFERQWDPSSRTITSHGLADVDAVINMGGAGIADARWTEDRKKLLRTSRLEPTETIVQALEHAPRCRVFLSGSAIGYYGDVPHGIVDESSPQGHDFLADLCGEWEAAADAAPVRVRTVKLRTGHVLAARGGILGKQRLIYQLGMGGRIGDGQQIVSWIAISDYVAAVEHILESTIHGPVNMVAPNPVSNEEFSKAYAESLNRPAVLPLPLPVAKAMFGSEMVAEAMLAGQRVKPTVLLDSGFTFAHPSVQEAMNSLG